VGGRSTFNYEKGLDIQVIQRVDEQILTTLDVPAAPTIRPKNNVFLRVEWQREMTLEELKIVYKDFDESYLLICKKTKTEYCSMPYTQFILARELAKGRTCYKVKQITNEYKIA